MNLLSIHKYYRVLLVTLLKSSYLSISPKRDIYILDNVPQYNMNKCNVAQG